MANSYDGRSVVLDSTGVFPASEAASTGISPFEIESVTYQNTTAATVDFVLSSRPTPTGTLKTLDTVTVPADQTVNVQMRTTVRFLEATGVTATSIITVHTL